MSNSAVVTVGPAGLCGGMVMTTSCEPERTLDPTVDPMWDQWVLAQRQATFFHTSAWARVLKTSLGHLPLYLFSPSGGLPLMEVNGLLSGRKGVSLPFTDECSPLGSSDSCRESLRAAIELGRQRNWRAYLAHGCGEMFPENPQAAPSYYTHLISLDRSEKDVFSRFRESTRRNIRRGAQSGLRVEVSTKAASLREYYQLHCVTRRRHGIPPQPWQFFECIGRYVVEAEHGFVVLAYAKNRGQPISGAVFFRHKEHAIFKYGASDDSFQNVRPNNAVLWAAIQHLMRQGVQVLSLGRTSVQNAGLRQFKQGWGSTENEMRYLRYDYESKRFVHNSDDAYGWYNYVFRFLPLFVSRCAGNILYRYWA